MVAKIESATLVNIYKIQGTHPDDIGKDNGYYTCNAKNNFPFKRIGQQHNNAHINKHQIYPIAHIENTEHPVPVLYKIGTL